MSRLFIAGLVVLGCTVWFVWLRTPMRVNLKPVRGAKEADAPLLKNPSGKTETLRRWQSDLVTSHRQAPAPLSQPSNIMVVVKTSTANDKYTKREGRVAGILKTWFPLASNNTWFISDKPHAELSKASGNHLIVTPCPSGHSKPDLCCKLEHEFKLFQEKRSGSDDGALSVDVQDARRLLRKPPEWFCHIDDDMYLFPKNLESMLANYDPAGKHFIGPSNLFPDDTLHRTLETPEGSTSTGLHHPCNGVYCMSYALVDLLYPKMKNGQFSASCTKTPDDIAITDLAFSVGKTSLTVVNEFHHQHSKNYKLPFFDPSRLQSSAITLYGYDDLPSLHAVLYGNIGGIEGKKRSSAEEKKVKAAAAAAVAAADGRLDVSKPWWDQIANLTVLPPKGKSHNLGFNFCRRSSPPPDAPSSGVSRSDKGASWCGTPVFSSRPAAVLQAVQGESDGGGTEASGDTDSLLEPLCESRSTYKEMHPTHKHTDAALKECPWTAVSAPQSFGTPRRLDGETLRQIKLAHHPTSVDEPKWPSWQYSKGANPRVWQGLAKRLARLDQPGTCCIANPNIADEEGGKCYWTAPDQGACLLLATP